jgi:hypothetical protein
VKTTPPNSCDTARNLNRAYPKPILNNLRCLWNPPTHQPNQPNQPRSTPTAVKADVDRSCLILETGVNQRWRYGGWRPSPDSIEEAQGWEEAKEGTRCGGANGIALGLRRGQKVSRGRHGRRIDRPACCAAAAP